MTPAKKFDKDKVRYALMPAQALEEIVKALEVGAKKYGDRDWEKGYKFDRAFSALMRHAWAWWRGETKDPESGLSHMAHAACCAVILLTFELRKRYDLDNRENLSCL